MSEDDELFLSFQIRVLGPSTNQRFFLDVFCLPRLKIHPAWLFGTIAIERSPMANGFGVGGGSARTEKVSAVMDSVRLGRPAC